MIIVEVKFIVKEKYIDSFIEYTKNNTENSQKEPGVLRFDFYKKAEVNNEFILFEVYKSADDQLKHRETEHFQNWKKNIVDFLETPYEIIKYESVE